MATALARRGAAALARWRGMCSSSASAPAAGRAAALSSEELMRMERDCSAHNYHPIPVVFSKGEGSHIVDPEGNKYIDFLSAYSAVNQGHCHPKVLIALIEQAERLTLSSRAFYNDKFPIFAEYLTSMFGYDMMLPMNTGAEGVETAIKLARKWGYEKKQIPKNEALLVSCCGCFHGRTLGVISMSCDNDATRGFGPLVLGHLKVDFGDIDGLKKIFEEHGDRICGFLFEPIQGEAGVCVYHAVSGIDCSEHIFHLQLETSHFLAIITPQRSRFTTKSPAAKDPQVDSKYELIRRIGAVFYVNLLDIHL